MKTRSAVNTLSSEVVSKNVEDKPCLRAKLDTGTFCNYDCSFCYYQGFLKDTLALNKIKEQADHLRTYGIQDIELSGGESSISKDWFDILDYVKDFRHISTLSHGGKFANKEFIQKSYDKGLREILFSMHGGSERVHNKATGRTSFSNLLKAISNAKELGMIVRINCTVYHMNYTELVEHAELCKTLDPLEVNYIALNYFESAQHTTPVLYKDIAPHIQDALDILEGHIKYLNVRYIPFCFMKGYEKYVCDTYQHIYDRYDWNLETYGIEYFPYSHESNTPNISLAYAAAKEGRENHYSKPRECITCSRLAICDGVDTKDIVSVIPGRIITNPVHFREGMYKDYDQEIEQVSGI